VVLVPKKNGKMRMCIDFIDLNKAYKKRPIPSPKDRRLYRQRRRLQTLFSTGLFLRIPPDLVEQGR
jgi:hypothetical protein